MDFFKKHKVLSAFLGIIVIFILYRGIKHTYEGFITSQREEHYISTIVSFVNKYATSEKTTKDLFIEGTYDKKLDEGNDIYQSVDGKVVQVPTKLAHFSTQSINKYVKKANINWKEVACHRLELGQKYPKSYYAQASKKETIKALREDGFTKDQTNYAVKHVKINYGENAYRSLKALSEKRIKSWVEAFNENGHYTKNEVLRELLSEFPDKEAQYAINKYNSEVHEDNR